MEMARGRLEITSLSSPARSITHWRVRSECSGPSGFSKATAECGLQQVAEAANLHLASIATLASAKA